MIKTAVGTPDRPDWDPNHKTLSQLFISGAPHEPSAAMRLIMRGADKQQVIKDLGYQALEFMQRLPGFVSDKVEAERTMREIHAGTVPKGYTE